MGKSQSPVSMEQLREIAVDAGKIAQRHFDPTGNIAHEMKEDKTPLTDADRDISRLVIKRIRRRFSKTIDIYTEEGVDETDSPWRIICDPVDGTFAFKQGIPTYSFMIAIAHEGVPIMGLVHDPAGQRTFFAEKGRGAFMHDHINKNIDRMLVKDEYVRPFASHVSWPTCEPDIAKVAWHLEREHGFTFQNFGSIGYMDSFVASGTFVATIFPGPEQHDTAAGHVIVEEAGGMVTDLRGRPLFYRKGEKVHGHIMSCGPRVHNIILDAIKKHGGG